MESTLIYFWTQNKKNVRGDLRNMAYSGSSIAINLASFHPRQDCLVSALSVAI